MQLYQIKMQYSFCKWTGELKKGENSKIWAGKIGTYRIIPVEVGGVFIYHLYL